MQYVQYKYIYMYIKKWQIPCKPVGKSSICATTSFFWSHDTSAAPQSYRLRFSGCVFFPVQLATISSFQSGQHRCGESSGMHGFIVPTLSGGYQINDSKTSAKQRKIIKQIQRTRLCSQFNKYKAAAAGVPVFEAYIYRIWSFLNMFDKWNVIRTPVRGRHCASLRLIQEPPRGQVLVSPQPGPLALLGPRSRHGFDRSRGISSCGASCCSSGWTWCCTPHTWRVSFQCVWPCGPAEHSSGWRPCRTDCT